MNKKGQLTAGDIIWVAAPLGLLIVLFLLAANRSQEPIFDPDKFKANYEIPPMSFSEVPEGGRPGEGPLVVLDFLFGKVPGVLVNNTDSNLGAAIITIAIWLLFFLIFADIMNTFGSFSRPVSWTVAALLAIIGANLKIISFLAVFFLSALAVFGSLAVMLSLFGIFVMFVVFHFGTSTIRRWVIMRRAEDHAIRAVAGGKRAASGIEVLKEIVKSAEK